jgi:hypothetical protein
MFIPTAKSISCCRGSPEGKTSKPGLKSEEMTMEIGTYGVETPASIRSSSIVYPAPNNSPTQFRRLPLPAHVCEGCSGFWNFG